VKKIQRLTGALIVENNSRKKVGVLEIQNNESNSFYVRDY